MPNTVAPVDLPLVKINSLNEVNSIVVTIAFFTLIRLSPGLPRRKNQ